MTTHILTGNFATDEAVSLDNEAHAIDPSVFLPQKNTALVNREAGKDLHAHSENAMDVLDSHKSKTARSIACIGTMQDVDDFTSLCANSHRNAPSGDVPHAVLPRLNGRRICCRLRYFFYIVDNRVAINKFIALLFY